MPEYYEVKVKGHLDQRWLQWFAGMTFTYLAEDETLLSGLLTDQAAIHGLLERVRDLNLTLLSVTRGGSSARRFNEEIKEKDMKILVAGSNGMIGSAVTRYLIQCGYQVSRLVRHAPGPGEVEWSPDDSKIDAAGLEGFDGVVQVASMPWPMRWTAGVKKKLAANRVGANRLLAASLAGCGHKPKVLVCAAGQGYYPPSGDDVLTEDCPMGASFLARLDEDGELATATASRAGIRVVHLRIPMVLGGERLKQLGFQAGDGRQWMSWVGQDELASIIEFALHTETLSGPVNASSPNPMRLADFARVACEVMGQKPGGAMPAFMVRLIMGEMGEEFLLASRRVQPAKLLAAGYQFRFPHLADALRHEKDRLNAEPASQAIGKSPSLQA